MPVLITANWLLNGTPIMGPNSVGYAETPTIGLRMDGVPQRQGSTSLELRYDVMPAEEYQRIELVRLSLPDGMAVQWLDRLGTWQQSNFQVLQGQVGRRNSYFCYGVTFRLIPVYYSGSGIPITTGETPTIYPGFGVANQPPVARISYSAAIIGDPQVVVSLSGTSSSDSDGVIVSYAWADNSDAFQAIPEYPAFDPPHESSASTATFVYEYVAGMPNPVITLTVTDNAGLIGTKTITVNIASLIAETQLSGKKFIAAAGTVFYSFNGGLSYESINGYAGDAISAAGPSGAFVWGTDAGTLYYAAIANPSAFSAAYSFPGGGNVTSVSVSPQNPIYVVAATDNGEVAYSTNSGQTWTPLSDPGLTVYRVAFNQEVANEICVVGTNGADIDGLVKITRDWGSSWQTDVAGLSYPAEGHGIARNLSIRYLGLSGADPSVYAATGLSWVSIDMGGTYDITDLTTNGNRTVLGDAQGNVHRVVETDHEVVTATGQSVVNSVARDPDQSTVILIGTDSGLYKSLDEASTVGLLGLPSLNVRSVDFLHSGGGNVGEVIICIDGGGVDTEGVWYHTTSAGWVRRNTGLPSGWRWFQVVADPYDANHWAVWGNTSSGSVDYETKVTGSGIQVIATGTSSSPKSPVWVTSDAGATWTEVPLYTSSHVGHGDTYDGDLEWEIFGIRKIEFDRVTAGRLFAFGGGKHSKALHGIVWFGSASLQGSLYTTGTALAASVGSLGIQHNNANLFTSGESGPDGGTVLFADANGDAIFTGQGNRVLYATSASVLNLSPGGASFDEDGWDAGQSGTVGWLERQPVFNSTQIALSRMTTTSQSVAGNWIEIYGTPDYVSTGPTYKTHVANRKMTDAIITTMQGLGISYEGRGASMTYASDGVWVGNGMGLVQLIDPFVSGENVVYSEAVFFREVRSDRQYRNVIGAYAYADSLIHLRDIGGWSTIALPDGVSYSLVGNLEVVAR